ncbi:hypothetical protein FF011L_30830 [Roseimaritima multifibrata]|uniref:Uncharacterized protein n=1 Tax=Roseimaritima multifibrata TaxID=1930274 RepID=A0A517MHE6_9BACT|nr:hypothetical protein FF011L_30830 [Roseimaritima multifibrata]
MGRANKESPYKSWHFAVRNFFRFFCPSRLPFASQPARIPNVRRQSLPRLPRKREPPRVPAPPEGALLCAHLFLLAFSYANRLNGRIVVARSRECSCSESERVDRQIAGQTQQNERHKPPGKYVVFSMRLPVCPRSGERSYVDATLMSPDAGSYSETATY